MKDETRNHPLTKQMKRKGFTPESLSKECGKSPSAETIRRIQRREIKNPRPETLALLADKLDCEAAYLSGAIPFPTWTVSGISEQIPLNEDSIELLIKLKSECDNYEEFDPVSNDSHMKRLLLDEIIRYIITPPTRMDFQHLTPTEFMELTKDYLHYESVVYEEKGMTEESHSEEYRKAKRQMRATEREIGAYIGKCIGYRLQTYYAESYGKETTK